MTQTQPAPGSLDEVRAVADGYERLTALKAYIDRAESKTAEARNERDRTIKHLADTDGPAEVAKRSGYSLTLIKLARKAAR